MVANAAVKIHETSLVRYDGMCRAIDAAYEVDELKNIRDHAVLLEKASCIANNVEAERRACEIRLRAERKAAKIEKKQGKDKGGRPKKNGVPALPKHQ